MTLTLGTKAETLERLRPAITKGVVLPQVGFSVARWRRDRVAVLREIELELGSHTERVIVRSTSFAEDTATASQAGAFKSVLDVPIEDLAHMTDAVEAVIESYGADGSNAIEVFCQPMVADVATSGVVFSRELSTLSPYFVVNYDDVSGRTDSVTTGDSGTLRTLLLFRERDPSDERFVGLIDTVREIEALFGSDSLDIEFAVSSSGVVHILQVRSIVSDGIRAPDSAEIAPYLEKIHKKVAKLSAPRPYVFGRRTILGIMTDWNPAEMIGVRPRPFALSLYKELITDRTWAYQRDNYGYKNLRSQPLLVTLIGHPYIDVRLSFGSFIPKGVSDELAYRLCDHYLDQLAIRPESHDKVEFDIVLSCFFLGIDSRLEALGGHGFSVDDRQDIRNALLKLTNGILRPHGVFEQDLAKIDELNRRQRVIVASDLSSLEKIYWLTEYCKRYGTLPFAGLARAGFIAVQLLQSFVSEGLMTTDDFGAFMESLRTIAKVMQADRASLSRSEFLERYGHLRPGTYDILSRSYEDAYDLYFPDADPEQPAHSSFRLSPEVLRRLDMELSRVGIEVSSDRLVDFIKKAIEGREHAKFVFTRSVHHIMTNLEALGTRFGLSLDDISFLSVRTLLDLYATLDHRDLAEILPSEIERNRRSFEITQLIRLPALIVEPDDIYEFELAAGSPNFVTLERVQAEVVPSAALLTSSLEGKIVMVHSADPGFDWIFTRRIGGLVTMYGGANSHMAIRAAELRIPAVIGAGERSYGLWAQARILDIDAANRSVTVIR